MANSADTTGTDRDQPGHDSRPGHDTEGRLSRWSRRKLAVKEELDPPDTPTSGVLDNPKDENPEDDSLEPLLSDEDMPAIETIGSDTNVSCFFNRGVSEELRQLALKRLLRLPAFNVVDGLNDYDEDYTSFEPLGDIVTSDMRFHEERKAKAALEAEKEANEALKVAEADEVEKEFDEGVHESVDEGIDEDGATAAEADIDDEVEAAEEDISAMSGSAEQSDDVAASNTDKHVSSLDVDAPGELT